jgi:hypothetical protein
VDDQRVLAPGVGDGMDDLRPHPHRTAPHRTAPHRTEDVLRGGVVVTTHSGKAVMRGPRIGKI